jgi:hypothetical protein
MLNRPSYTYLILGSYVHSLDPKRKIASLSGYTNYQRTVFFRRDIISMKIMLHILDVSVFSSLKVNECCVD